MAHKVAVQFSVLFESDGTSTSIQINLATKPVTLTPNITGGTIDAVSLASATDAVSLYSDWEGGDVTKQSLVLGVLTLGLATAPPDGFHTINGTLLF